MKFNRPKEAKVGIHVLSILSQLHVHHTCIHLWAEKAPQMFYSTDLSICTCTCTVEMTCIIDLCHFTISQAFF